MQPGQEVTEKAHDDGMGEAIASDGRRAARNRSALRSGLVCARWTVVLTAMFLPHTLVRTPQPPLQPLLASVRRAFLL